MAQHLRFVLDGDDHLTPALVTAGNSSALAYSSLPWVCLLYTSPSPRD